MTRTAAGPLPADVETFLSNGRERFLRELVEFLRIPSISTLPERRADVAKAAEWLVGALRTAGLEAEAHSTPGHPIVLGEWRGAPRGAPNLAGGRRGERVARRAA